MTAAKAVETSVTSTNSLSQDYTDLDDQLRQTCHDPPRFKPFTLCTASITSKDDSSDVEETWFESHVMDEDSMDINQSTKDKLKGYGATFIKLLHYKTLHHPKKLYLILRKNAHL